MLINQRFNFLTGWNIYALFSGSTESFGVVTLGLEKNVVKIDHEDFSPYEASMHSDDKSSKKMIIFSAESKQTLEEE